MSPKLLLVDPAQTVWSDSGKEKPMNENRKWHRPVISRYRLVKSSPPVTLIAFNVVVIIVFHTVDLENITLQGVSKNLPPLIMAVLRSR